jgi:hypothetical protein
VSASALVHIIKRMVALYEQGTTGIPYLRVQADLAAGKHAKAAAEFEKLIVHRRWDEWPESAQELTSSLR